MLLFGSAPGLRLLVLSKVRAVCLFEEVSSSFRSMGFLCYASQTASLLRGLGTTATESALGRLWTCPCFARHEILACTDRIETNACLQFFCTQIVSFQAEFAHFTASAVGSQPFHIWKGNGLPQNERERITLLLWHLPSPRVVLLLLLPCSDCYALFRTLCHCQRCRSASLRRDCCFLF